MRKERREKGEWEETEKHHPGCRRHCRSGAEPHGRCVDRRLAEVGRAVATKEESVTVGGGTENRWSRHQGFTIGKQKRGTRDGTG